MIGTRAFVLKQRAPSSRNASVAALSALVLLAFIAAISYNRRLPDDFGPSQVHMTRGIPAHKKLNVRSMQ